MRLRLQGSSSLWTRRAVLWIELAAILAWLGLAIQDGRLILSSAIVFSYLILTMAFSSSPKSTVTLQRVVQSERVFEEQSVLAGTAVENASDEPTLVRVSEECPEGLALTEGGLSYIIFLQPSAPYNQLCTTSRIQRALLVTTAERSSDG